MNKTVHIWTETCTAGRNTKSTTRTEYKFLGEKHFVIPLNADETFYSFLSMNFPIILM